MIIKNDEDIEKKINQDVLKGIKGGKMMNVIEGKDVEFEEELKNELKIYEKNVVDKESEIEEELKQKGIEIVQGGKEKNIMMVDMRKKKEKGKREEEDIGREKIK